MGSAYGIHLEYLCYADASLWMLLGLEAIQPISHCIDICLHQRLLHLIAINQQHIPTHPPQFLTECGLSTAGTPENQHHPFAVLHSYNIHCMKKKNNAVGTFPQRFLACLSKLKYCFPLTQGQRYHSHRPPTDS